MAYNLLLNFFIKRFYRLLFGAGVNFVIFSSGYLKNLSKFKMHNLFFVATLVVLVKGAPNGAYKPFKPDEEFLESVSHLPFEVDANKDGYIDFDEYEDLFDALYPRVHPTPSTPFVDYWDMFYYVKVSCVYFSLICFFYEIKEFLKIIF